MNIISSHKMFIISPSVTRAAVRGWFWVLGCSSDMSGCIHWDWYWYPGDCLRISATSEAILPWPSVAELRHRPRITSFWGSFCELTMFLQHGNYPPICGKSRSEWKVWQPFHNIKAGLLEADGGTWSTPLHFICWTHLSCSGLGYK